MREERRSTLATELALRRFTVDEYLEMAKAGILTEDDRVELIDGQIIEMSPIGDPHVEAVNRCLRAFLLPAAAGRLLPSAQNPVRVDRYNDPQPDVVLVPPGLRGAPRVADALLVIEVADSSLSYDRRIKLPLYARAGIREAWLLDLQGEALEVHREPGPEGYALIRRCRRGERVAPVAFPDPDLAVDDLLPLAADSASDAAPDA
jgi:Uma2 family endonuclease